MTLQLMKSDFKTTLGTVISVPADVWWEITAFGVLGLTSAVAGNRFIRVDIDDTNPLPVREVLWPNAVGLSQSFDAFTGPAVPATQTLVAVNKLHMVTPYTPLTLPPGASLTPAIYNIQAGDAFFDFILAYNEWRDLPVPVQHVLVDLPVHTVTP